MRTPISHWFFFPSLAFGFKSLHFPVLLISFCVDGIRLVSRLISSGSCCSECPLLSVQRLALQQPQSPGLILLNTWCPWDMFSLFQEHRIDFELITRSLATDGRIACENYPDGNLWAKSRKMNVWFLVSFWQNI